MEGARHSREHRATVVLPVDANVVFLGAQLASDVVIVKHFLTSVINSQQPIVGRLTGLADALPLTVVEDGIFGDAMTGRSLGHDHQWQREE